MFYFDLPLVNILSNFLAAETNDQVDEDPETANDHVDVPGAQKKPVQIAGRDGDYQAATNVLDRYPLRPNHLEDMTLAQFATIFIVAYQIPKNVQFDSDGCSTDLSEQTVLNTQIFLSNVIKLKEMESLMKLRRFPLVLRIHSSKRKEGHEEHYSELVLFVPWRDERKEFCRWDPKQCIEIYNMKKNELQANKAKVFPGEEIIDALNTVDLEQLKPSHLYDSIASQNVQQNDDDQDLGTIDDPDFESFAYTGNLGQEINSKSF